MSIGQRIKERREELKMSQETLAHKLGYVSRSSITKIEKSAYKLPQTKIKEIADALGTTPAYIMGWEDESFIINSSPPDYDKLDDADKAIINTMIENMLRNPKYEKENRKKDYSA